MHRYRVRPGYHGGGLLIEFEADSSDERFVSDLHRAFSQAGLVPEAVSIDTLLAVAHFDSPAGPFGVEHDEWCNVFIHADSNPLAIHYVDGLLWESGLMQHADYGRQGTHATDAEERPRTGQTRVRISYPRQYIRLFIPAVRLGVGLLIPFFAPV
jgi:hypothetical protein